MKEFAKNLKALRKQTNTKQKTLADSLGITPSVVSQYERGKAMPGYDVMLNIADFFHVSVDYLLGRETPVAEAEQLLDARFDIRQSNRQFLAQCAALSPSQRRLLSGFLQLLLREGRQ